MIVSIHQPEFFPWVSFFDKVDYSDTFVLLDSVQFEKNYFQNRCKVRDSKGSFQIITLPVLHGEHELNIAKKEIVTSNERLLNKMLKTIQSMYAKTPFYKLYYSKIEEIIRSFKYLGDLNSEIIYFICGVMGIKTKLVRSTVLSLDENLKSTELLLEICKKEKATSYLSGKMGINYLDDKLFVEKGVKVIYHDYNFSPYPQLLEKEFIPCLSSLDLLFNCGNDSLKYIREGRTINL